jgi:MFS family permease
MVLAPVAGVLVGRLGTRFVLSLSMALAAVGFVALIAARAQSWGVIAGALILFTGISFGYASLPVALIEHVDPGDVGIATGVNSVIRSVGSALASAFAATVLARDLIPHTSLPREEQYALVFTVGAVIALLTAGLVSLALPSARPAAQIAEQEVLGQAD